MTKNKRESATKLISDDISDDDSLLETRQDLEEDQNDNESDYEENEDEAPIFVRPPQIRPLSIYESLDYDVCENTLWEKENKVKQSKLSMKKDFSRWIIFLMIGVLTALVACTINIVIEEVSNLKYGFLKRLVDSHKNGNIGVPFAYWVLTNAFPVLIGALMVTYIEPVAAGSGIPQVKCYLNGIKVNSPISGS